SRADSSPGFIAISRRGPSRIQSRMAWTCCSALADAGTIASENPSRYFRTEYSHPPAQISATTVIARSEFVLHQAMRKLRCLPVDNSGFPETAGLCHLLIDTYKWPVQTFHGSCGFFPAEFGRDLSASGCQSYPQARFQQHTLNTGSNRLRRVLYHEPRDIRQQRRYTTFLRNHNRSSRRRRLRRGIPEILILR